MNDQIYHQLREILDSHPNGFPATQSGVEIKLLKKVFTPEEAEMATKLKFEAEMPEQIAQRTGLEIDYVIEILKRMVQKGQLFVLKMGDMRMYTLIPWAVGVFEFQGGHMDKEFAKLANQYWQSEEARVWFTTKTSVMRTIPIEKTVKNNAVIAPYESIRMMIDNAKSYAVGDCICRKEALLNDKKTCDNPLETCLRLAPIENIMEDMLEELSPDNNYIGRVISRDEAHQILDKAEESGLVHTVENYKEGIINVCNCCGCCCIPLKAINRWGAYGGMSKSHYVAKIDSKTCIACEQCLDRCQVQAIDMEDSAMVNERCIGCGLCATTCPVEAITLVKREESDQVDIPEDPEDRAKKRGKDRGMLDKYMELKV